MIAAVESMHTLSSTLIVNSNLEWQLSIGDVDVGREPVEDPADGVRVEEGHRAAHDPVQQLLVDQLRRLRAAQQERQVHHNLGTKFFGKMFQIITSVMDKT
jgi:hypothetical protein